MPRLFYVIQPGIAASYAAGIQEPPDSERTLEIDAAGLTRVGGRSVSRIGSHGHDRSNGQQGHENQGNQKSAHLSPTDTYWIQARIQALNLGLILMTAGGSVKEMGHLVGTGTPLPFMPRSVGR